MQILRMTAEFEHTDGLLQSPELRVNVLLYSKIPLPKYTRKPASQTV